MKIRFQIAYSIVPHFWCFANADSKLLRVRRFPRAGQVPPTAISFADLKIHPILSPRICRF
jgi:hypothetical protein